jgi:phosphonatase-like hydrolase
MVIELVVFDIAGTTVDDGDAVNHCFRAALARAGLAVSHSAANSVMGLPKPLAIRTLIECSGGSESLLAEVDAIHTDFVSRMIRFYAEDPAVVEVPGASRTFATLRQAGIKVALNTGFSRAIVARILPRLGWDRGGPVDATIASDEVARGRPHPDMIQRLMAELGIRDASVVAKVGDTPVDLEEGTNAGCGRVIGVTRGTHTHAQLAVYPHTDLIETVADLPRILGLNSPDGGTSESIAAGYSDK